MHCPALEGDVSLDVVLIEEHQAPLRDVLADGLGVIPECPGLLDPDHHRDAEIAASQVVRDLVLRELGR